MPSLDSVIMSRNSIRRFSLFMWANDRTSPLGVRAFNATHLVAEHNGGGGVVLLHGPVSQGGDTENPYSAPELEYVIHHPVSVVFQTDSWRARFPISRLGNLEHGGHFYTTNVNGEELDEKIVSYPLGAMWPRYELYLGDASVRRAGSLDISRGSGGVGNGRNDDGRPDRLRCCCMSPRANRHERIREMEEASGGVCSDNVLSSSTPVDFPQRLSRSRFAVSMVGQGRQCFRDTEILLAGAVPLLDGYISGGKKLYGDDVPALHMEICRVKGNGNYCNLSAITPEWLDAEYAKIEERRAELNLRKFYWPYWLYHVFAQVPAAPATASGAPLHHGAKDAPVPPVHEADTEIGGQRPVDEAHRGFMRKWSVGPW